MDVSLRIGDGYFNFDSRFDIDGGDLLDNLRWRMQIDDTFVESHLKKREIRRTSLDKTFDKKKTGINVELFGDRTDVGNHRHSAL